MQAHADIHFDGWTLRREPRELLKDGVRVKLQDMPLQVLEELLSTPGQLVTREQLIGRLWPKRIVEFDTALNAAVRRLRATLGDEADTPRYIETVPRQGYRFVGTIRASRPTETDPGPGKEGASPPAGAAQPVTAGESMTAASRPRWQMPAATSSAAGILALAALLAWALIHERAGTDAAAIAIGEVEVQPFTANPPDPPRAARAASFAGAFRQRLTEMGIRNAPADTAHGKGHAEFILSGELNEVGGKNVLTARLDDRQSGATLWSTRRVPSEGAAWESNLAAFALKCALKRRDPKQGPEALSRYIYGCAHFLERDFAALHAAAKELYDRAPHDPQVIAFYAFANAGAGWAEARSSTEANRHVAEATRLAQMALQMDPHNADALFTMGFSVSDFQFAAQEDWWRRAIQADPEAGWALGRYAKFLADVGRVREAVDVGVRAQLYRRVTDTPLPHVLASIGELQSARAQYALIRPMDPEWVSQEELFTEVMYGDADAVARKLAEQPGVTGRSLGCYEQILAARRKQSLMPARFAEACRGEGDASARAFALAGNLDAAYRELETYLGPDRRFVPQLFWPEMRGLIRDRRFWPFVARLGLVDYWLDSNQWPDFCAEPDLPFDCKEQARKARSAGKPR